MHEPLRISTLHQHIMEGPAWHGPAVLEVLRGITAEQAFAKPIPTAHTIAELVMHITTWERVILRVLSGESEFNITDEENFPTVTDPSDATWASIVGAMRSNHLALRDAMAAFDESRLDEVPAGAKSTFYVLMHGAIQHDVWHAGQIMIMKKMV